MTIKVLAGDWTPGTGCSFVHGMFGHPDRLRIGFLGPEFDAGKVAALDTVTDQNKTSILGKAGWGAVGLAVLGPLGMLAGLLGGGNRHEKIVALELTDGRRALLRCDPKSYALMMRLAFKPGGTAVVQPEPRPVLDLSRTPAPVAPEPVRLPAEPAPSAPTVPDFMRGVRVTYGDRR